MRSKNTLFGKHLFIGILTTGLLFICTLPATAKLPCPASIAEKNYQKALKLAEELEKTSGETQGSMDVLLDKPGTATIFSKGKAPEVPRPLTATEKKSFAKAKINLSAPLPKGFQQ